MTVAVLVVTDGRDHALDEAVRSAWQVLDGQVAEWWMYDDTGRPDHHRRLVGRYPWFQRVMTAGQRLGFGGAIGHAWELMSEQSDARWVFHLEDDFVFERPLDLAEMAAVLEEQPHLAQMALRRQAWNAQERAAGGVVEQHPDDYTDREDAGWRWLEHRRFFTTNPSLYRAGLMSLGWPTGRESEGHFTARLLAHGLPWGIAGPDVRFGYWGGRDLPPWVRHIGHARAGTGY